LLFPNRATDRPTANTNCSLATSATLLCSNLVAKVLITKKVHDGTLYTESALSSVAYFGDAVVRDRKWMLNLRIVDSRSLMASTYADTNMRRRLQRGIKITAFTT